MHENSSVEVRTHADETAHDVERVPAHLLVISRDGEARRLDQQPMQPGDGDTGAARGGADGRALLCTDAMRILAECEGSDFKTVVAECGGKLTLSLERQRRDDLVAERDTHGASVGWRGARRGARRAQRLEKSENAARHEDDEDDEKNSV